jgi:uncharacterized protein (DUF58 family)
MEKWILKRYTDWLDRRIPRHREITLAQNNIFIYPNWQFIYYFIAIMLLWIAATNYENNLSFALSFLLLSLFLVCILHTFNNLAGLTVSAIGAEPVFAGEYAAVEIVLSTREGKIHDALNLGWEKNHFVQASLVNVTEQRIKISVKAAKRGFFSPGRMTVETVYPLGIIRSVSYLDLDVSLLVYPQAVCHAALITQEGEAAEGQTASTRRGSDEFSHLGDYERGASLKQVAWKQFAKGRGLQLKQYADYVSEHHWLDWDHFSALGVEERLSTLCYWALVLDKRGDDYGLRVPGVLIAPGSGNMHCQKILTALALYGSGDLKK